MEVTLFRHLRHLRRSWRRKLPGVSRPVGLRESFGGCSVYITRSEQPRRNQDEQPD